MCFLSLTALGCAAYNRSSMTGKMFISSFALWLRLRLRLRSRTSKYLCAKSPTVFQSGSSSTNLCSIIWFIAVECLQPQSFIAYATANVSKRDMSSSFKPPCDQNTIRPPLLNTCSRRMNTFLSPSDTEIFSMLGTVFSFASVVATQSIPRSLRSPACFTAWAILHFQMYRAPGTSSAGYQVPSKEREIGWPIGLGFTRKG